MASFTSKMHIHGLKINKINPIDKRCKSGLGFYFDDLISNIKSEIIEKKKLFFFYSLVHTKHLQTRTFFYKYKKKIRSSMYFKNIICG